MLESNNKTTTVKQRSWEQVKQELLNNPNCTCLDLNDCRTIEYQGLERMQAFEITTDDVSEQRLNILCDQFVCTLRSFGVKDCFKMLFCIQVPDTKPITASEKDYINETMDKLFSEGSEFEIKWGIATREDNLSSIVCGFQLLQD